MVKLGRGSVGDRALHPSEWDPKRHEIDREWYAEQVSQCMRRLMQLCCDARQLDDALAAGRDRQICGSSSCAILQALGAEPGVVWRKRHAERSQPDEQRTRNTRQKTLMQFFQ